MYVEKYLSREFHQIIWNWIQRNGLSESNQRSKVMSVSEGVNFANVCYQLHARDKKLARIIDAIGPCNLIPRHAGFDFLVDAIISQQLSKQAADTITQRFRSIFHASRPTPKAFMSARREKVLESGISARKYEYILDLTNRIESGQLRLFQLSNEDDSTIRIALKQVKGIGDWTVDMYLLFGLARLDVFPVHDLALRKEMSRVYGVDIDDVPSLEKVAAKWKPYRSVGAWYLYKSANSNS